MAALAFSSRFLLLGLLAAGATLLLSGTVAGSDTGRQQLGTDQILALYESCNPVTSVVPGAGLVDWWTTGPLVFKEAVVTSTANGTSFSTVPHRTTIPPGPFGTLDHVKHLSFSNKFTTDGGNILEYEVEMSTKVVVPASLPYPATDIADKNDDPRLGSCCANFVDFETMLVADLFLTNTGVWALYERLPFARTGANNYYSFTQFKRIASRTPDQVHTLKFRFNNASQTLQWVVDGKVGLTVNRLGRDANDPKLIPGLDLGGTPERIFPRGFQAGFGCFTLLDMADPNQPDRTNTGLLNLNPFAGFYTVPTAHASSNATDESLRLFGQGTELLIKRFKVTRK